MSLVSVPFFLNLTQIHLDDHVEVQIDNAAKFIFVIWFKHPESQELRKVFQILANLTLDYKIEYWLSDARAIHYLEFSDQNWLIQDIAPLLKKSKLTKFARLTTEQNLELMDVVRVYGMIKQLKDQEVQTEFELFTNEFEALSWLFPYKY